MDAEVDLRQFTCHLMGEFQNLLPLNSKSSNRHILRRNKHCYYRGKKDGRNVISIPYFIPGLAYLNDYELLESAKDIIKINAFHRQDDVTISESSSDAEALVEESPASRLPLKDRLQVKYEPRRTEECEKKYSSIKSSTLTSKYGSSEISLEDEIRISLKETPTFILLDVPSKLVPARSPEGFRFEEVKKLKKDPVHRKLREAFCQTRHITIKNESTQISAPTKSDVAVEAYESDRRKTYIDLGVEAPQPREQLKADGKSEILREPLKESKKWSLGVLDNDTKVMEGELLESNRLLPLATLTERILTMNLYSDIQLLYNERMYSSKAVDKFKYAPVLTWTFSCPRTSGKAVTCISWNSNNPEIFVAGYGKHLHETKLETGLVCLWNVKNIEYPERMSVLHSPVTSVEFSKKFPSVAGVSFWDGSAGLLDLAPREPEVLTKCSEQVGALLPIWKIKLYRYEDDEIILACGENGEVHMFKPGREFEHRTVTRVKRVGNSVRKGIVMPQVSDGYGGSARGPSARCMARYPGDDNTLLVGTDEGYVNVYSMLRAGEPMDAFGAHLGPVSAIEFNPAEKRAFLTAGGDGWVRVWGYGVYDTFLVELNCRTYRGLEGAVWSPSHPYVIASISNTNLEVWDLRRGSKKPVSKIKNPYKNRNHVVSFNPLGSSLLVGDAEGHVFVYGLTSIPKPPDDPSKRFAEAMLRCLKNDKERLKLIALRLGPPFITGEGKTEEMVTTEKIKT